MVALVPMSDETGAEQKPKKKYATKTRRVKSYHVALRLKVLRMISDGISFRETAKIAGVSLTTVMNWCKETDVASGSKLTTEELEAKMEAWRESCRSRGLKFDEEDPKAKAKFEQKERKRFGPTQEERDEALAKFQSVGDLQQYLDMIGTHFNRITEEMYAADTPEGQVNAALAGTLLVQLKGLISAPPAITTMGDMEKFFKMIRTTFGMDQKEGNEDRADLRVLNAKVSGKGKIREAEIVKEDEHE